jgi:hypothetical protein
MGAGVEGKIGHTRSASVAGERIAACGFLGIGFGSDRIRARLYLSRAVHHVLNLGTTGAVRHPSFFDMVFV